MRKISRFEREALLSWRAEMALYTQGELTEAARGHLRTLLERGMEAEIDRKLGAPRYVRTARRSDWRNGYRQRDLTTAFGLLRGLRVPRSRKGDYETEVFARYQRRQPLVNALIMEMFIAGVATRRVGEVLEALLGDAPSATTVSRIAQALDERVKAFHSRALQDAWRFLVLDGVTMKVKGACGVRKRLVLVAYGMDGKGKRELLAFRLADSEAEKEWAILLEDMRRRGLCGDNLELVITDGAKGLTAALSWVYPYTKQQRCWAHKLRNVANKVRRIDQKQAVQGAQAVYLADNRKKALLAFRQWKKRWQLSYPKAVACLENDLDALLRCFAYPQELRSKIRTTNAIERSFRELRRRTRPMSVFSNDQSCERIVYALIQHLNTQWRKKPFINSTHFS